MPTPSSFLTTGILRLVMLVMSWAELVGFAMCSGTPIQAKRQGAPPGLAWAGAVIGAVVFGSIIVPGVLAFILGWLSS